MQYFVSIENTSYFHWQIELLIESFLAYGLEDNLIIGVAESKTPRLAEFSKNIVNHKSLFLHQNEGENRGYKPFNRIYSLIQALKNGMLKSPFVLMHSDMVLVKPIPEKQAKVVFHHVSDGKVAASAKPYAEQLAKEGNISMDKLPQLIPFNGPIIIQDGAEELVWRVKDRTEMLLKAEGPTFPCEKVGWSLAFYEMLPTLSFAGEYLECGLLDIPEKLPPIIHYKSGILPHFHKRHFTFEKLNFSTKSNPLEMLLEYNPTPTTNYVRNLIFSYMGEIDRSIGLDFDCNFP